MSIVKLKMEGVNFGFSHQSHFTNEQLGVALKGSPKVYEVDEDAFKDQLPKGEVYIDTFVRFVIEDKMYVGRAWYAEKAQYFLLYCPPGARKGEGDNKELSIIENKGQLKTVVTDTPNCISL